MCSVFIVIRLLFCAYRPSRSYFPVSAMTKTSKPGPQSSTQGQCGVWLDPVELKATFKKVNTNYLFYPSIYFITPHPFCFTCRFCYQIYFPHHIFFVFQKQRFRPISKQLNPLARGSGYSLAVALNYTQTKTVMPNTKQSSISSFFTPQRRGQYSVLPCRQTDDVFAIL